MFGTKVWRCKRCDCSFTYDPATHECHQSGNNTVSHPSGVGPDASGVTHGKDSGEAVKGRRQSFGEFIDWWIEDGHFYDPDSGTDWHDKRQELAAYVWVAARKGRTENQVGREVPHDSLVSGRYYWWKGEERMPWQPVFVRPGERTVVFGTHCNAWNLLFGEFREMPVPDDLRTVAGTKS